jgi:cell division protein FtsB
VLMAAVASKAFGGPPVSSGRLHRRIAMSKLHSEPATPFRSEPRDQPLVASVDRIAVATHASAVYLLSPQMAGRNRLCTLACPCCGLMSRASISSLMARSSVLTAEADALPKCHDHAFRFENWFREATELLFGYFFHHVSYGERLIMTRIEDLETKINEETAKVEELDAVVEAMFDEIKLLRAEISSLLFEGLSIEHANRLNAAVDRLAAARQRVATDDIPTE